MQLGLHTSVVEPYGILTRTAPTSAQHVPHGLANNVNPTLAPHLPMPIPHQGKPLHTWRARSGVRPRFT